MNRITKITLGATLSVVASLSFAYGGAPTQSAPASALPHEDGFTTGKGVLPLVDDQGRQIILQGLNSGRGKHTYMRRSWETEVDVEHQAKKLGYNTHRYLIFWDHVMQERGVINTEYLDDVEARLQWFADNDMKVVLDMHQDNWGEQCGGNGAPAWASSGSSEPAPGAPWWIVAASPCVVDSQLLFYSNALGWQDEFANAWKAVAQRFADHPAVFAYDLLNEPTEPNAVVDQMMWEMLPQGDKDLLNFAVLGTVWIDGHPYNAFSGLIKDKIREMAANMNLTVPESYIQKIGHIIISRNKGDWGKLNAVEEFEGGSLSDMYQKVINNIREVDNDTYVFVEPMSIGVNHGHKTFLRGLNDPRSGERRLGYMPHLYPRDLHEGGAYAETDWARVNLWEANQREFAHENNMAWIIGEFGHSPSAEGGVDYLTNVARMAERNQLGWEYWDSGPGGWSPIASDKVSDTANAKALVNIYPRAVAGKIESYHFDRVNQTFTLTYRNANASGTTDISVPPRFSENGLVVTSTDAGSSWSYYHDTDKNVVSISHDANTLVHTISIKPDVETQALVYADLKVQSSEQCLDFAGTLPAAGKGATVYECSNKQWQQWAYDEANQFIRNNQNPDYCLSHGDASLAIEGAAVKMALCSDLDDHRWIMDGNVIRNIYNQNIVLDAFGASNGSQVGQWSFHGGNNQRWYWAWRQDSGSMESMIGSMSAGQNYELLVKTQLGGCGLEWDANLNNNNERNAKFDCSGTADPIKFTPIEAPVINSNGSVSVRGRMYSAGCGFEWDGAIDGEGERNAKWDCGGAADVMRITSASYGATAVLASNSCGLEWSGKLDKDSERNAKFDCHPRFDELRIQQIQPEGYFGGLSQLANGEVDSVPVRWTGHQKYSNTLAYGSRQGRYVRIRLLDASALSLAEVRVLDAQGNNLAQGKTASQSSTAHGGVASRAVDGNIDGVWANGSVTHTSNQSQSWWQVDLGATVDIAQIDIFNRSDCCSERLNTAVVEILK